MKNKREPREQTENINFMKPIDLTQFGTSEDPCFGKLYDATAPECKQCGDCELCFIVHGQNQHLVRGKEEGKNTFMDKEMPDGPEKLDRTEFDKQILTIARNKKGDWVLVNKLNVRMKELFDLMGGEANIEVRNSIKRLKAQGKIKQNKAHTKIKISL